MSSTIFDCELNFRIAECGKNKIHYNRKKIISTMIFITKLCSTHVMYLDAFTACPMMMMMMMIYALWLFDFLFLQLEVRLD